MRRFMVLTAVTLFTQSAMAAEGFSLRPVRELFLKDSLPCAAMLANLDHANAQPGYDSLRVELSDFNSTEFFKFTMKDLSFNYMDRVYAPKMETVDGLTTVDTYDLQWDEVAPETFEGPFVRRVHMTYRLDPATGTADSLQIELLQKNGLHRWKGLKTFFCAPR